ncbi:MAG TPA: peptidoglycan DD-metalloendopeptidase family protein [Gammaproteobacteria bacterium]|nr:peptidoglycan DD-metalloendopeptidase family protein [Gammaproteobacteria bacterium]
MVITLLSLFIFTQASTFAKHATPHENLKTVQKKINEIKNSISHDKHTRENINQQIKNSNLSINQLGNQIIQTSQSITALSQELKHLKQKCKKNSTKEKEETQFIFKTFHSIYMKVKPRLEYTDQKPWHNQDIELDATYVQHIINKQQNKLKKITHELNQLNRNRAKFLSKRQELMDLTSKKQNQKIKIKIEKQNKRRLIHDIDSKILNNDNNLKKLIINKRKLEEIIKNRSVFDTNQYRNIKKIRHQLTWPLSGKIIHRYGDKIHNSEFKFDALHIQPISSNIRSLSDGVIIFDRFLEGYGKLLIIDHGHGVMSLYGNCSSFAVKHGQRVSAKQIIAKTNPHQLSYFGIRVNSKPQNPFLWLKKSDTIF